ncbi:MAG: hypothetical protein ACLFWL_12655 [Candidatus Brocadiia bacterium]
MYRKKYELTDGFLARSEDGRDFTLHVYEAIPQENGRQRPAAPKVIRTTSGYYCESVDGNGTYRIQGLDLKVQTALRRGHQIGVREDTPK